MITYADIKKYGKDITVDGKNFLTCFDFLANSMHSCGLCSKLNARKHALNELNKGMYGHKMFMALKNIETLKSLEVL